MVYFQVDLEPQGKLHLKIDLQWNSQGIYLNNNFIKVSSDIL